MKKLMIVLGMLVMASCSKQELPKQELPQPTGQNTTNTQQNQNTNSNPNNVIYKGPLWHSIMMTYGASVANGVSLYADSLLTKPLPRKDTTWTYSSLSAPAVTRTVWVSTSDTFYLAYSTMYHATFYTSSVYSPIAGWEYMYDADSRFPITPSVGVSGLSGLIYPVKWQSHNGCFSGPPYTYGISGCVKVILQYSNGVCTGASSTVLNPLPIAIPVDTLK